MFNARKILSGYERQMALLVMGAISVWYLGEGLHMLVLLFGLGSCASDCGTDGVGGDPSGDDSDPGSGDSPTGSHVDGTGCLCDCSCQDGTSSSPFLCLWDKNKKEYFFENDVLVGPKTRYASPTEGKQAYESGAEATDSYMLSEINEKDDELSLQLREIEPEESFLNRVRLERLSHPTGTRFVSNAVHDGFYLFSAKDMDTQHGTKVMQARTHGSIEEPIATDPLQIDTAERILQTGDVIEFHATVETKIKRTPFFVLRSRYRDWQAGILNELEALQKEKTHSTRSPLQWVRTAVPLMLAAILWVTGMLAVRDQDSEQTDIDLLAKSFGARSAHANVPTTTKSLVVEFWNWEAGQYEHAGTVQPRYAKATLEAVPVPESGVSESGEIRARVTATQRHAVDLVSLFVPESGWKTSAELPREALSLKHAYHNRLEEDMTEMLTSPQNTRTPYVHLVPGDVLDIAFEKPARMSARKGQRYSYIVTFDGFYANLSSEGGALAGDQWVANLDRQSRELLEDMYARRA